MIGDATGPQQTSVHDLSGVLACSTMSHGMFYAEGRCMERRCTPLLTLGVVGELLSCVQRGEVGDYELKLPAHLHDSR